MTENLFGKKSYEYAVGAIRASSHSPLTPESLKRLEDTDLDGFAKLLDEFSFAKGIEGSVEERIEGEFNYAVDFIKEISPDERLTDLLFFESDAVNLKLFAKARLNGTDATPLADRRGSIPIEIIRGSVEAWDFSLISEEAESVLKNHEEERDPFVISSLCDRAIFLHTLESAKKLYYPLYEMLLKLGEEKNKISRARLIKLGIKGDMDALLLPVPYSIADTDKTSPDEIIEEAKRNIESAKETLRTGENFAPIAEYFFAKKKEASELKRIYTEKIKGEKR